MSNSFHKVLENSKILQIFGVPNSFCAKMSEQNAAKAIYLSGSSLASNHFGLPDLSITNLTDLLSEVDRITDSSSLPLLVDIDTGFGNTITIERCIKKLIKNGAKAAHIEDQTFPKRCGHREGKGIVSSQKMCERIIACKNGMSSDSFYLIARTDAMQCETKEQVLDRCNKYIESGANAIFLEGAKSLDDYMFFTKKLNAPLLANSTEFGVTPIYSKEEFLKANVKMILYPVTLSRVMNKAFEKGLQSILREGFQKKLIPSMQTREELYRYLSYFDYEKKIDENQKESE